MEPDENTPLSVEDAMLEHAQSLIDEGSSISIVLPGSELMQVTIVSLCDQTDGLWLCYRGPAGDRKVTVVRASSVIAIKQTRPVASD